MISYKDELYHHGIKGQKWGVRRYRNEDGSLTNAGKERYSGGNGHSVNKKKIAAGIAAGVGLGLAAYAMYNPKSRAFIAKVAKSSISSIKKAAADPKVKEFVKINGKKALDSAKKTLSGAGKAATDAAIATLAGVAVAKITEKYMTSDQDDEKTKIQKQVISNALTAGLTSASKSVVSSSKGSSSNKGANVGKEVADKLGPPNGKTVDKSSKEYQALFKDQNGNNRPDDVRAAIKSLSKQPYGLDQLQEYIKMIDRGEIKHSDIERVTLYIRHRASLAELYRRWCII